MFSRKYVFLLIAVSYMPVICMQNERALIDCVNKSGDTPLHLALKTNQVSLAKNLVAKGADIYALDGKGRTCLSLFPAELRDQTIAIFEMMQNGKATTGHNCLENQLPENHKNNELPILQNNPSAQERIDYSFWSKVIGLWCMVGFISYNLTGMYFHRSF